MFRKTANDMVGEAFVKVINDANGCIELLFNRIARASNPHFVLCLAGSQVSDRDGISAAGVSPSARRLTPAIDAEALLTGKTHSADCLPVSPKGIVSPVVITRAALQLCNIGCTIVDCGTFHAPLIPHVSVGTAPASCPVTGEAMPLPLVKHLFDRGIDIAKSITSNHDLVVVAECVPGGTTTALGVMMALGLPVHGAVSSSLPHINHSMREQLIIEGLGKAARNTQDYQEDPLLAISAVGDPMQAFVCGFALQAARDSAVVLGGGSQMLAVSALLNRFSNMANANTLVATTKWVAFDNGASSAKVAQLTNSTLIAACPDFHCSRHIGLQAYEEGNVKEGVGAGASMLVAHLRGWSATGIVSAIDRCYDKMVLGNHCDLS